MQIKDINQVDFSKLNKKITLIVPAQNAKLGPPVGAILGQAKIKVKDFCSLFNDYTKKFHLGFPLRVLVYVYKNDSFNFIVYSPSITFFLKNFTIINKKKTINLTDIYKIALIKQLEQKNVPLQIIFRNIINIVSQLKINIV